MSEVDNIYLQNLNRDNFSHFGATDQELLSYALDEVGLLDERTVINGKSARELTQNFYRKRDKFRQNTRLGHILMSEDILSKEQLIDALAHHVNHDVPLGQALVELGMCTRKQIDNALKQQTSLRRYI